jgi:hypothetical protein
MWAELVSKKCQHLQEDGSKHYYAIKIHGINGEENLTEGFVLRLTEFAYSMAENPKSILQEIVDRINS